MRGSLESDLQAEPWQGPGVDNGAIMPGQYIISSTFLRINPTGQQKFQQVLGPILSALKTQPGLVAYTLATSSSCGTARTLAAWTDLDSMLSFVTEPAHGAAVAQTDAVASSGSTVTHWSGDQSSATFATAVMKLAAVDPLF
jgi:quinol monooxygenase YgiN